jgi:hypothetical protein
VRWSRPLEVGDVLADEKGARATVAAIEDGPDLRWGARSGEVRVAKVAIARDRLQGRSIGPYSWITQQPHWADDERAGQEVDERLVRALLREGAEWAAWELLTIKSDSIDGRIRLYEHLAEGRFFDERPTKRPWQPEPPVAGSSRATAWNDSRRSRDAPDVPFGVRTVLAELRAAGLEVALGPPLRARWSTDADVRAGSHSPIASAATVEPRTHLPVPGGLVCERIFGPLCDYTCACGEVGRGGSRGTRCPECGVERIESTARRERFAHVELAAPVPHPWRAGTSIEALPMLPAGLRPIAQVGGRLFASDLNELYASVIEESLALEGARLAGAPDGEIGACAERLRVAVEQLFQADGVRPDRTPIRSLRASLEQRFARAIARRVDYSGVAHVVLAPGLGRGVCRLPREMATELWRPMAMGLLVARGHASLVRTAKVLLAEGGEVARAAVEALAARWVVLLAGQSALAGARVELWDAPAVGLDAATARELGAEVVVHVPVTAPGASEVGALVGRVVPIGSEGAPGGREATAPPAGPAGREATAPPAGPVGWLARAIAGDVVGAARAAGGGEEDGVPDPALRLWLGWWPRGSPPEEATFAEDVALPPPDPSRALAEWSARPIAGLAIADATREALAKAGIATVGELCGNTEVQLLKTKRLGRRSLLDVKSALEREGLRLATRT